MPHWIIIAFFFINIFLYIPLNRRKAVYYWKSRLDDRISIVPYFVIPYLLYFPFFIAALFLTLNTPVSELLPISMVIAYSIAEIFWYLFPNGVKRPVLHGSTIYDILLRFVYRVDHDTNGFPSAHVFISVLCGYFLWIVYPDFSGLIACVAGCIVCSTVLTKQHVLIDIIGGILVSVIAIGITNVYF